MENSCRKKYKQSSKNWVLASRRTGFRRNSALIPANAGLFHYAGNNPVRYIDPDGNYINLRNTHEENHEYILKMINKMSILQYKIVDGKMKIDAGIINHYGSETFNRDMLYAFCSDFDISVLFATKVPAYVDKETPDVYGGTCYFFDKSKKAFIILAPDENEYPIIKTKNGEYSLVKMKEVFGHELSGHIVPMIKGKNGNAVSIENEIRRQMGLDEREEEPDHASF